MVVEQKEVGTVPHVEVVLENYRNFVEVQEA
jgi:hypothetical protein